MVQLPSKPIQTISSYIVQTWENTPLFYKNPKVILKVCLNLHCTSYSVLAILEVSQNGDCLHFFFYSQLKTVVSFVLDFIFLIQFLPL